MESPFMTPNPSPSNALCPVANRNVKSKWDLIRCSCKRVGKDKEPDKEPACQCRRHKRHGFDPWVSKIPWRRAWHPTPVFLPGESQGQRNLAGDSPQGHKELDTTKVI